MSIFQYTLTISHVDSSEINEQWYGTPVPLEELPAGLIEDQI